MIHVLGTKLDYYVSGEIKSWSESRGEKEALGIQRGGCSGETPHLALARDGLIEQQAAAILLLQAGVVGPCRDGSSPARTGAPEGLEVVGGQRRRRRGRVGLIAGGGPAPVAP